MSGDQIDSPDIIIISVSKRDVTLVNVPFEATVLVPVALPKYNRTDLAAIGDLVPGVDLNRGGSGSGAFLSIRKFVPAALDYGGEEPAAVSIDGVSITRGDITDLGLFDMASPKGPQALFIGKNDPAGEIAIHSRRGGRRRRSLHRGGTGNFEGCSPGASEDYFSR